MSWKWNVSTVLENLTLCNISYLDKNFETCCHTLSCCISEKNMWQCNVGCLKKLQNCKMEGCECSSRGSVLLALWQVKRSQRKWHMWHLLNGKWKKEKKKIDVIESKKFWSHNLISHMIQLIVDGHENFQLVLQDTVAF